MANGGGHLTGRGDILEYFLTTRILARAAGVKVFEVRVDLVDERLGVRDAW